MATYAPPPILEIEDQPFSYAHPGFPPQISTLSVHTPHTPHKGQRNIIALDIDVSPPHINDHAVFWSIYNKVADEFDAELLKGWNNSLDVLLIFAGLFSAINTAFIAETYSWLPHYGEGMGPDGIPVNFLFFLSLFSSLSAAFGAVTAKQWLTEYSNQGLAKAPHIHGTQRLMKYKGLECWHFRLIIDFLPVLLQLSLFLFLVGVVVFLWVLDMRIGIMQLILVVISVAAYSMTLIIGVTCPTSPFRTPLTKYLEKAISLYKQESRGVKSVHQLAQSIRYQSYIHITLDLVRVLYAFLVDCCMPLKGVLWHMLRAGWSLFRALKEKGISKVDNDQEIAAECVVWLLEHSEHSDSTIVALDAARRLPPELMCSLISQRGLSERLEQFCSSLLPLGSTEPLKWVKRLSDEGIISAIAWLHIYGARSFQEISRSTTLYESSAVIENAPVGSSAAVRLLSAHNLGVGWVSGPRGAVTRSRWLISLLKSVDFSSKQHQFHIELNCGTQTSQITSLSTIVSLPQLALDALTLAAHENYSSRSLNPEDSSWTQDLWNEVPHILQAILEADSSLSTISHVAVVVAAIERMICSNLRSELWYYPTEEDQERLGRLITELARVIHKK
ncbi:hypothetical protein FRC03_004653 [Tulasnella sp. 419]|nr:hypothetical protein FRC03_004653 [Tulasnella sp. 419]